MREERRVFVFAGVIAMVTLVMAVCYKMAVNNIDCLEQE